MIEALGALDAYYDMLLLEPASGLGSWGQFRVIAIKDNLTIEEQGADLGDLLQRLLVATVHQVAQ